MTKSTITILAFSSVCALSSGAQTLTATYIELADSADVYMKNERWGDAERVIVNALRHEPANKSNYMLWSNLGTVRTNMGDYDGALQAFDIGLSSAPNSTMLVSNRARTLIAKGETIQALADLDKALELDSALQWPRKMRGIIRAATGNLQGATEDLETYTGRFGKDAAVAETLGDIALTSDRKEEALSDYKEAYGLGKDETPLLKLLLTALETGRLEEYEEMLNSGISEHPNCGNLYLVRARLKKNRYQTSDMELDLKRAKELGADKNLYDELIGTPSKSHLKKG